MPRSSVQTAAGSNPSDAQHEVKRGPGRPRKNPLPPPIVANEGGSSRPQPAPAAVVPPATAQAKVPGTLSAVGKRRPGRPTKTSTPVLATAAVTTTTGNAVAATAPAAAVIQQQAVATAEASPAKKGRGRPKKITTATEVAATTSPHTLTITGKRGRPAGTSTDLNAKNTRKAETHADEPEAKRRRGRPPSSSRATIDAGVVIPAVREAQTLKKRRGRPPASNRARPPPEGVIIQEVSVAKEALMPPKKRGRPPASSRQPAPPAADTGVVTHTLSEAHQDKPSTKKRGRPPLNKAVREASEVVKIKAAAKLAEPQQKGKRCRPPKQPLPVVQRHVSGDAANQQGVAIPPSTKKRGRPPKVGPAVPAKIPDRQRVRQQAQVVTAVDERPAQRVKLDPALRQLQQAVDHEASKSLQQVQIKKGKRGRPSKKMIVPRATGAARETDAPVNAAGAVVQAKRTTAVAPAGNTAIAAAAGQAAAGNACIAAATEQQVNAVKRGRGRPRKNSEAMQGQNIATKSRQEAVNKTPLLTNQHVRRGIVKAASSNNVMKRKPGRPARSEAQEMAAADAVIANAAAAAATTRRTKTSPAPLEALIRGSHIASMHATNAVDTSGRRAHRKVQRSVDAEGAAAAVESGRKATFATSKGGRGRPRKVIAAKEEVAVA